MLYRDTMSKSAAESTEPLGTWAFFRRYYPSFLFSLPSLLTWALIAVATYLRSDMAYVFLWSIWYSGGLFWVYGAVIAGLCTFVTSFLWLIARSLSYKRRTMAGLPW